MKNIHLTNVTYSYDGKSSILENMNWTIHKGTFHCLVGRSGCGKTSLLKLAAGLLQPTAGEVLLNGNNIEKPLIDAGIVFQSPTLLEWKTVLENVLLPITLKRKSTSAERERALSLLATMKIEQYSGHYPRQLSGGQQSRVAIARALMNNPSTLFLDEPFAALDALTREELQMDLLSLCHKQKMTVLFITHDLAEAVFLADHVAVMEDGQIIRDIPIKLEKPRTLELRYGEQFNDYCLQVRHALEGVSSK